MSERAPPQQNLKANFNEWRWHLKRESGDIGGVFSLVWQRFPDGWKIIHDHTSAVVPPKQISK